MIREIDTGNLTQPRHLVGSLQERVWSVRIQPPENLIPDNTQQDGQQQTGSNATSGGYRVSHDAWPTLKVILPERISKINKYYVSGRLQMSYCHAQWCRAMLSVDIAESKQRWRSVGAATQMRDGRWSQAQLVSVSCWDLSSHYIPEH